VSGLGTYIYVQTKVYLDAGYSNISPNYGVQNDVYLVQNRPNAALLGGGGSMGYSNIDYEAFWKRIGARIQKLVDEALVLNKKEILKELEGVKSLAAAAKGKPFNYEILERIESLIPEGVSYEKIKSLLPIPADHRADLQYLASELQKIPAMVDHRNEIISLKAELNGLRNIVEKMMKATEDSTSTINTFKSKSQQIAKMKQLMSELHKTGEGVFDAAQTTEPEQLPGFMTYMKNKGFKS
jgi:DNA-binding transcriptional MerR regulator